MNKLSIIIPSYNSGKRVLGVVEKINKVKLPIAKEIIIVDDASRDSTYNELKKIKGIVLFRHKKNTGKGGAVKTGLSHAKGDILFIQDDDLEYDPHDIPSIINPILEGKAEAVFGSRRLNKNNKYSSKRYYYGGVFADTIISILLLTHLTDAITGSKAFTRNAYNKMKPINSTGFEIEAEIAAKLVRNGIKPVEVPISYSPRSHKEGKNIRWHHLFPLIKTAAKYSLTK